MEKTYNVEGLSCAGCARTVENTLKDISGVDNASVNLAEKTAAVSYTDSNITFETLSNAVADSGYKLAL
ncbi:heavy-metal-associated domain-containing protein [Aerococcaceae bacterium DSM 111022]|nr:heavy-metal-associated domain-containing protein [Aerococcaceae bacterium DSM 111022]